MTQEDLKRLYHYDPATGDFTRRITRGRWLAGMKAGSLDAHGYGQLRIGAKNYKLHHLAWLYVYGALPNQPLDHIDLNRANNAISNLRYLTPKQHVEHRGVNKNNKSGFRGVSICGSTGRWVAQIKHNYRIIWLGRFDTPEAASAAYKVAAKKYHTHNPEVTP